jgi:PAS domain S-box-containing protein
MQNSKNIDLKYITTHLLKEKNKYKIFKTFKKAIVNKYTENIEFQIVRDDDKQIIDVSCRIRNIKDPKTGTTIVLLGTIQDVTKFVALRNKLFILEQAVNQAPISIVVTDKDANIEYVNPSFTKVTGYMPSEVIGKNANILKSQHTNPEEYKELWQTIKSGESWSGTFKNIKKNKEEFWEIALISPVFSPKSHKIIKYLAVKEEITGKLYLEKELKHKEEMLIAQSRDAAMGEMISMIAHQWRQPATAISLCASNILTDLILDNINKDSFQRNAQMIVDQTQYLSDTIDDFRDFFKPNKEKNSFYLKEAVDETYALLNATLENKSIKLDIKMQNFKKVKTYKKELVQVLINLIKNAQEALVEKNVSQKSIQITEYEKHDHLVLQICDNAGGISNENIGKIFEPYFTTKTEKNGTGLGLYISKQIVEKHLNGKLHVQNKNDGACFHITIPY